MGSSQSGGQVQGVTTFCSGSGVPRKETLKTGQSIKIAPTGEWSDLVRLLIWGTAGSAALLIQFNEFILGIG